jgi:allantoinase
MTLVVRGGTVVSARDAVPADVVVDDGVVVSVTPAGTASTAGARVVDAGGLLVLPGAVDPHVHFDEPGREDWEGFDTGSAAAAAGGITTVVDMPIDCDPPTTTAARVEAKVAAAQRSSRVDVALWGGLVPSAVPHLDAMAAAGVAGFKAFACPSGWDDFPAVDEATLAAGFRTGLPVAVHCELAELGHTLQSEVAAVRWAASVGARESGRLHVVHASSRAAIAEARKWQHVTVETCPHYLLLDAHDVAKIGPDALCAPPVRDVMEQPSLADVDCLASDHSPCPPGRKRGESPWAGITGVETSIVALLSAGVAPTEVVRAATNAARILNLRGKGAITPGSDADLALVDLDRPWTVGPETLWCRHKASPFTGRTMSSRVVRTYVRGQVAFDLDDGPAEAATGRVLRLR